MEIHWLCGAHPKHSGAALNHNYSTVKMKGRSILYFILILIKSHANPYTSPNLHPPRKRSKSKMLGPMETYQNWFYFLICKSCKIFRMNENLSCNSFVFAPDFITVVKVVKKHLDNHKHHLIPGVPRGSTHTNTGPHTDMNIHWTPFWKSYSRLPHWKCRAHQKTWRQINKTSTQGQYVLCILSIHIPNCNSGQIYMSFLAKINLYLNNKELFPPTHVWPEEETTSTWNSKTNPWWFWMNWDDSRGSFINRGKSRSSVYSFIVYLLRLRHHWF